MRVLQLGKYYPPVWGGIETVTWDLAEGLNRRGIPCDVLVAGSTAGRQLDTYPAGDAQYRVLRAACRWTIASTPISVDYVNAFREMCAGYDLAILHMPNPLACVALFMSGFPGKVGLIWHSDVIRQRLLLQAFRALQTWTIRRADFVVGATPAHIDESDNAHLFAGKSAVIPFGLDPARACAADDEVQAPGHGREVRFLAVGRIVYYKGYDVLIEALAATPSHYRLTIVGEGPLRPSLEAKVRQLGMERRVTFTGHLSTEALAREFARCDVVCLPSVERSEMYGMVQLEAMVFGKPLIVSAIPRSGTRYVVRDGVTGIAVPPGDTVALARALRTLGESPALRADYGAAGRRLFFDEYTADKMVERHIALYRDVLGRNSERLG